MVTKNFSNNRNVLVFQRIDEKLLRKQSGIFSKAYSLVIRIFYSISLS